MLTSKELRKIFELAKSEHPTIVRGATVHILKEEKLREVREYLSKLERIEIYHENEIFCRECSVKRQGLLVKFVEALRSGEKNKAVQMIEEIPAESARLCKKCTTIAREQLNDLLESFPDITLADFTATSKAAYTYKEEIIGREIQRYMVGDAEVRIIETPDGRLCYDITPPSQNLTLQERSVLAEILETSAERALTLQETIALLERVCTERGLSSRRLDRFLNCYLHGFGDLQYMIEDENLTDIFVFTNGRITVEHYDYSSMECTLRFTREGLEALALAYERITSKTFSMSSPVSVYFWDEHNCRISAAGYVANFSTIPEFTIRKWPSEPWSVLELIRRGSLSFRLAALLNLAVYSGMAIIIAGDKGGGKSTLLNALLFMIPRRSRKLAILTDREIHSWFYKNDFRISELRVHTGNSITSQGVPISQAVNFMLVFGEAKLTIFNEIKFKEEAAPFFGTTAVAGVNSIATTMHASSPEGIIHRLIYSFELNPEAVRNIDLIVMAEPRRDLAGRLRRAVTRVTEIQPFKRNPLEEGKMKDIARFNGEDWDFMLDSSHFVKRVAERFSLSEDDVLSLLDDLEEKYRELFRRKAEGRLRRVEIPDEIEEFFRRWCR